MHCGKILREKTVADLNDGNDVFLVCSSKTVHFMTAVGKDVAFFQQIIAVSVSQLYFAL